jgi:hypothetical protein
MIEGDLHTLLRNEHVNRVARRKGYDAIRTALLEEYLLTDAAGLPVALRQVALAKHGNPSYNSWSLRVGAQTVHLRAYRPWDGSITLISKPRLGSVLGQWTTAQDVTAWFTQARAAASASASASAGAAT